MLTPGGMGSIAGARLKFDPEDAAQGIFLLPAAGSATRVQVVGKNKPGELVFLVPAGLESGEYTLEVRASGYSGEVRTGVLDATLMVA